MLPCLAAQGLNRMGVQLQRLEPQALAAFQQRVNDRQLYRVAAQLWARGILWNEALAEARHVFSLEPL